MQTAGRHHSVDHYLVARAQACATGANAHDLYALLGNYYDICAVAENDPTCEPRVAALERRIRTFCVTGNVHGQIGGLHN